MYRKKVLPKDVKLREWLSFLENPESEEVLRYMEKNENMKAEKEKLETMSEDERIRRLAELREKAIMDEKEAEYTGYCRATKEIAKNMKQKGIEKETIMELTHLSKEEIEAL